MSNKRVKNPRDTSDKKKQPKADTSVEAGKAAGNLLANNIERKRAVESLKKAYDELEMAC